MTDVKTLPASEALANENAGYMDRKRFDYAGFYGLYIGDNIVSWSQNTLSSGYTLTQPSA